MMKKIWKKIIAACCVAVMLMTLPGVNVLADELQDEDVIISVAEDPKALPEDTCHSSEDEISIAEDPETSLEDTYQSSEDEISFAEDILEENISEELVGVGNYGVNLNSEYYKQPRNPFSKPQCTWYAFGRALEKTGVEVPYRSNAVNWMSGAVTTPMANSIAVWKPYGNLVSSAGHVAFVEKIENGKLYISEGNRINAPEYSEGTVRLSDGYYTQTYPDTSVKYSYIVPNGYIPLSTTPTVSFTPWSNDNYTYIRETDASIGMEINASGGTITSEGMYLYDSNGSYLASASNPTHTLARVYFQVNAEMGYTLRGGTTYKYKFYAIVNGQTYWSDMYSFTTPPPAVTNINNCTVSLSTTSYTYNGSARTPSVTVKNGSTTLTSGTDYTVSYSNNVNAGTATVTITGKGYYTGTVYRNFTISKATAALSFAYGSISKTALNTTFANSLTKTTDGTVTFKSSNTSVATVNSTSGLVTTRGVGTATITATSTEGNNYKAASASYTLTVGIVVGNNVFATFDETTGAVEFYSNNGELWRDWVEKIGVEKTKITSLKIASGKVYLPKDSSNIFAIGEDAPFIHDSNLKELDLSGFDTSRVTNMSEMFLGCGILTELDLRNFNTSKVTNMSGMFKDCRELTALDLSSFDTSNVTDMSYMFSANMAFQVYHLKRLNLESFNTSKVKNMSYMFYGCYEMPSLDLSNFDTSNVTDMSYMFNWCQNLTSLNIKNFVTSNVSNMASMFAECYNLTELDVSGFDTSNVTNMGVMFGRCRSLTKLDVSSFDTSNVTNMGAMFSDCRGLTKLDVSSFDTSNVTRMQLMFSSCANLTNLDLSSFDTSKVNIMRWMFSGCTNLKSLNLSNFNISNVEDMGEMFEGCSSLESLDLSSFNKSLVPVSMNHMFWNCSSLRELNLRGFDTSKTTSIGGMFSGCSSLTKVDLSSFDTSNVTDMRAIFSGCNSLTSIDLSSFNTSNLIDMQAAFEGCSSLLSIDLSSFDTSNLKGELATYNVFLGCSKLELLKTPKKQTIASIALPYNMYDSAGNVYTELPLLSKSIVLTKSTSIQNCSITLSSTSYTYDGKEKKPAVTVKNGTTTLTNNTDYTVAYSNNTNAGTAKVTVTGKGNYAGTITKSFSISKATPSLKFANTSLSKTTTDAAFTNTLTKTTDGTVTFKSSNTAVATVNSTSGRVTIKGTGKTTITATATEGTNYKAGSAKYTLTVTESGAVQSISLSETSITMVCGNERAVPSVSYNPESATDGKTVNWISSNEKLVKVSDGRIRALDPGKAVITATVPGKNVSANADVRVLFTDVTNADAWYFDAVYWALDNNVTSGYGKGTFKPTAGLTRAQTVTFLYNLAGKPNVDGLTAQEFTDVRTSDWYYSAVKWAAANKITSGYGQGTFRPNATCTRSMIVSFLMSYSKLVGTYMPPESSANFPDVPPSAWYKAAVDWAVENGITKGYGAGTFSPDVTCNRAMMVTFLKKTAELPKV